MQVVVNGTTIDLSDDAKLPHLLERLQIAPTQIAVEINLTVIDKEAYDATQLSEGDQIEVISFIGGGCYAG